MPSQILLPWLDEIEAVGVAELFTIIVILLLPAITGLAQLRLLVIWQVTISPLVRAVVTKVGLFVPAGEPLTSH